MEDVIYYLVMGTVIMGVAGLVLPTIVAILGGLFNFLAKNIKAILVILSFFVAMFLFSEGYGTAGGVLITIFLICVIFLEHSWSRLKEQEL